MDTESSSTIIPRRAVTKIPYQPDTFASIPQLPEVAARFEQLDAKFVCDNVLGPLLLRYGLEEKLGFNLVHRNFPILHGEKLVEFNNVTFPWRVTSRLNKMSTSGKSLVYETSWMQRDDGRLMAYEFSYAPNGTNDSRNIIQLNEARYQNFLLEFVQVLRDWRLEKLIGLRAYPGDHFKGGLETCQDNGNIILAPGEFEIQPHWKTTDIMFFYAEEWREAGSRCVGAWLPPNDSDLALPPLQRIISPEQI